MLITLTKSQKGTLIAHDEESLEAIDSMQIGETRIAEIKSDRQSKNHRKWFKFVNKTFEMQDIYDDKEVWRKILQISAGHFRTVTDKNGNTHIWPESISYKEFDDEDKFRKMCRSAVQHFVTKYGHGITEEECYRIFDFRF